MPSINMLKWPPRSSGKAPGERFKMFQKCSEPDGDESASTCLNAIPLDMIDQSKETNLGCTVLEPAQQSLHFLVDCTIERMEFLACDVTRLAEGCTHEQGQS